MNSFLLGLCKESETGTEQKLHLFEILSSSQRQTSCTCSSAGWWCCSLGASTRRRAVIHSWCGASRSSPSKENHREHALICQINSHSQSHHWSSVTEAKEQHKAFSAKSQPSRLVRHLTKQWNQQEEIRGTLLKLNIGSRYSVELLHCHSKGKPKQMSFRCTNGQLLPTTCPKVIKLISLRVNIC